MMEQYFQFVEISHPFVYTDIKKMLKNLRY